MTSIASESTWKLDPAHSGAEFKVRHMMISHIKGIFTSLSGTLTLDEFNIAGSKVEASIDVASVHSGDEQRDSHLQGPEFFDAALYPTMTFQSTSVRRTGDNEYHVTGDLTLHGVTKSVDFSVDDGGQGKDPWGNTRRGITATTKINRKDFGLAWNSALETGGVLVGDEVSISIDAQFVKA